MYAVIFRATVKQFDDEYSEMIVRMRDRAFAEYGCLDFTACTEGNEEIAISYWPSLEHITAWKNDNEHLRAQSLGQNRWYENYRVQIVEVQRDYSKK